VLVKDGDVAQAAHRVSWGDLSRDESRGPARGYMNLKWIAQRLQIGSWPLERGQTIGWPVLRPRVGAEKGSKRGQKKQPAESRLCRVTWRRGFPARARVVGARHRRLAAGQEQSRVFAAQQLDGRLAHDVKQTVDHGCGVALPEHTKHRHRKTLEPQQPHLRMVFRLGDAYRDADAVAVGYISLHHLKRADFDAAEPVHLEFPQTLLKRAAHRLDRK